jgi:hypothetical protein
MYGMGPLLMRMSRAILSIGCTPILLHHTTLAAAREYKPLGLESLAYSGIQEFAAQWWLLNRRERYEEGTGHHRLWFTVGGRMGQSGCWAVDIEEGTIDENFGGRRWDVTVKTATEWNQDTAGQKVDVKRQAEEKKEKDDEIRVLGAIDRIDPNREGQSFSQIRIASGVRGNRLHDAINRLVSEKILEYVSIRAGNVQVEGVRRPPSRDSQDESGR